MNYYHGRPAYGAGSGHPSSFVGYGNHYAPMQYPQVQPTYASTANGTAFFIPGSHGNNMYEGGQQVISMSNQNAGYRSDGDLSAAYQAQQMQMRLLQARQQNLMYKQALMKDLIAQEQHHQLQQQMANRQQFQQRQKRLPQMNIGQPNVSAVNRGVAMGRGPQGVTGQQGMRGGRYSPYFFDSSSDDAQGHENSIQLHTAEQSDSSAELKLPPLVDHERTREQQQASARTSRNQGMHRRGVNNPEPRIRSRPPSRTPEFNRQPNQVTKNLSSIASDLSKVIDANRKDLHKLAKQKVVDQGTELREQQRKSKQQIESMLKRSNGQVRMPLWRHKLHGRMNPPAAMILKGKSLWYSITKSIIQLYIRPLMIVMKKRRLRRENERRDLARTLRIVADEVDDWIGKLIQLPVASIVQDAELNFEPTESYVGNTQPMKLRMLQLKVRLKAIVANIAKCPMPSNTLSKFLVTLIEEDNYFSSDMLWHCEIEQLDFTNLGATRDMIKELLIIEKLNEFQEKNSNSIKLNTSRTEALLLPSNKEEEILDDNELNPDSDPDIIIIGGYNINISLETTGDTTIKLPKLKVDARRVRLLIQNFIFIRILINHLLLSPWNYNICSKPIGRNARRILYNYRMLASIFYQLLLRLDSTLPTVIITRTNQINRNLSTLGGKYTTNSSPRHGIDKQSQLETKLDLLSQQDSISPQKVHLTPLSLPSEESKVNTLELEQQQHEQSNIVSNETIETNVTVPSDNAPKGILGKLSKFVGMNDTTPGLEIFSQDSIESKMLEPRTTFQNLSEILSMLIPTERLYAIKPFLDEWCDELVPQLRKWLRELVKHVLNHRLESKIRATQRKTSL